MLPHLDDVCAGGKLCEGVSAVKECGPHLVEVAQPVVTLRVKVEGVGGVAGAIGGQFIIPAVGISNLDGVAHFENTVAQGDLAAGKTVVHVLRPSGTGVVGPAQRMVVHIR